MGLPYAARDAILTILQGKTAIPTQGAAPAYLALFTTVPSMNATSTAHASVTEVSTPGYARSAAMAWTSTFNGDSPILRNTNAMSFGPFTATGANDVLAAGLVSATSGVATLSFWWPLMQGLTPLQDRSIVLPANSLILSLTV